MMRLHGLEDSTRLRPGSPSFGVELTAGLSEGQERAVLGLVPLGRAATPEEIAPAVVFFASEEAGYITGSVLAVDGGLVMH